MAQSAREKLAALETTYKANKKVLVKSAKVEEAKELSGLFDSTLNQAVEALRASVTEGLGVYHRNLKAVVVRVSVDAKGVTSVKNSIRTIRMTPDQIKVWDAAHPATEESTESEPSSDDEGKTEETSEENAVVSA